MASGYKVFSLAVCLTVKKQYSMVRSIHGSIEGCIKAKHLLSSGRKMNVQKKQKGRTHSRENSTNKMPSFDEPRVVQP